MLIVHVVITLFRGSKQIHAEPADVGCAAATFHVVAAICLLNCRLASRTVSDIILRLPLPECFVILGHHILALVTGKTIMTDCLTCRADGCQTHVTCDYLSISSDIVDGGAIWTRAILEVFLMYL